METSTKKCPYCLEEIKAEAIKCRYCKSILTQPTAANCWFRNIAGHRWLGVASMLAANTQVPVLAWRVGFLVLVLYHGLGLLVYLAIWALTPFDVNGQPPLERLINGFKLGCKTARSDHPAVTSEKQ